MKCTLSFLCFPFLFLLYDMIITKVRKMLRFEERSWGMFGTKNIIFGLSSLIQFQTYSVNLILCVVSSVFLALGLGRGRHHWNQGGFFSLGYDLYKIKLRILLYALFFTRNGLMLTCFLRNVLAVNIVFSVQPLSRYFKTNNL